MGALNELASQYGDVAEFFVVYIKEAHAEDSKWAIPIKGEEKIYKPKNLDERKSLAAKCMTKLKVKLPCLVDHIDNAVADAYAAWPDRIFVVDDAGKIAVRAERGPWGFKPGVEAATTWLAERFPEKAGGTN